MPDASFFSQPAPGLFIIRYNAAEDLAPAKQAPLMKAVREAVAVHPVGLMFVLSGKVRAVPMEVPTFWLGVTRELPLTAMAVVSPSLAVRMATSAFSISNTFQRSQMATESFVEEADALRWMRASLTKKQFAVAAPPAF